MANPIGNKVSTFTPVASIETSWIKYPAAYLKPFGGRMAVHLPGFPEEDGSQGAVRVEYKYEWYKTAVIIASYVLTLGILPLLAAIANVVIRCNYKFHWIENGGPVIDINNLQDQLGQIMQGPFMQAALRDPSVQQMGAEFLRNPGALRDMMGQLRQQIPQLNAHLQQLRQPPRVHGLGDVPPDPVPPLGPIVEPLSQRAGRNRAGGEVLRNATEEERRQLRLEAAEARLRGQRAAAAK